MGKLIRMDLYRMSKGKAFLVCLILTFLFSLASTPLERGLYALGSVLGAEGETVPAFPETANLCSMITSPISSIQAMLILLSVVIFFYADMENGYIKNIAGQMPKKGFSILSRFIATVPHNLLFMLTALAGNVLGTMFLQRIIVDGSVAESVGYFLLKLLLLESVCSILLLFTSSLRSKSLGMIFAVMFGLPVMGLIYMGINSGLGQIFKDINIIPYMPDQVMKEATPGTIRALLVSAVTIAIFLSLAISVFDKRDVK